MSLFLQAFLVALAVTIAFIDAHTTQTHRCTYNTDTHLPPNIYWTIGWCYHGGFQYRIAGRCNR